MDQSLAAQSPSLTPRTEGEAPTAANDRRRSGAQKLREEPVQLAAAMSEVYGPIAAGLQAVDARLKQELQSQYEALTPVLRHGTQLGGKRLRPALLLLSLGAARSVATGGSNDASSTPNDQPTWREQDVAMATVLEMVHTATLIHDDVLDKADTRRHAPTINAKWDSETSILLGDYLFSQSFCLAATYGSLQACQLVGRAAQRVCEGELRQVLSRDWLDIDEETYLDIIRGKTAELTRVACQLGAQLAGVDETIANDFAQFGNDLGIAFQIADDYLDLWGDHDQVGKTLGTDLAQCKLTLPIIRLLRNEDTGIATATLDALREAPEQRLSRIMPLLQRSDAAEYTREVATRYCQQAQAAIAKYETQGDDFSKQCLQSLAQIAEFSVKRKF